MNSKIYWKIRKLILTVILKCKKLLFNTLNAVETRRKYRAFRIRIINRILHGILKGIIIAIIVFFLDKSLPIILRNLGIKEISTVDSNIFVDVIICNIGVAGVILGLYCSSISSIYSTKYSNAPAIIASAFQNDRLTRKCILSLISYIVYGFLVIIKLLLGCLVSWISVASILLGALSVLFTFSATRNRTYQLSNVYLLADDTYSDLYKIITKDLRQAIFTKDKSFQLYYQQNAEKKLYLPQAIQKYGDSGNHSDSTAMVEFMCKNLLLINEYWKNKKALAKDSMWFKREARYSKWHLSSDLDTSVALQTGTALIPKNEPDYWWFENIIISINQSCLSALIKKHDYSALVNYFFAVEKTCKFALLSREQGFYLRQIKWLQNLITNDTIPSSGNGKVNRDFVGLVEYISLFYLNLILESIKYYQDYNFEKITKQTIDSIDSNRTIDTIPLLCSSNNFDFYKGIKAEIRVEGHRLTPDWVIRQNVAKEEYDYLNFLIDDVREALDQSFSFGKHFLNNGALFEACIALLKFYEYESKLNRFIEIAQTREQELKEFIIDKTIKCGEFRINKLKETLRKWKADIPALLSKCSTQFALTNWENREEFPDFLGESYNHICEDAVDAIACNNSIQFAQDFSCLSKLMLLYQEYIRTDFLKDKDKYRAEYAYYTFTFPIVEWAQIGGLAILYGEFGSNEEWHDIVNNEATPILTKKQNNNILAETLIEFIKNRDIFMHGINDRDILETRWNLIVANSIKRSQKYDVDYTIYGKALKTNSKLLKAYCRDFDEIGFAANPSEVFWIICVNPLIPPEKHFQSRSSWEKKLYE